MSASITLVIAGAGGLGREAATYAAEAIAAGSLKAQIAGFLDDTGAHPEEFGCPLPVLGSIDDFTPALGMQVLVAVGTPQDRAAVAARLEARGADFATLVHPLAYVATNASLAPGCIVAPFATVGPHARLNAHCLVNTHAGIGHDCRIGLCSVISPHAVINGWVETDEQVLVGSSAVVTARLKLGKKCKIAAGAVVYADIPAEAMAHGNPARARVMPEV
ncbi:NeuD/PglB/VioB family sugar acetyltransferase [Telmatospirillum sp. J64-1]|uniref:NeuD/PglB/VioB family sugar acetyltransferase n=1 Tax=Telmatospirillum sp. J64-1 TaxID=2502183 RepID=UPI00115C6FBD|nr:NeuD/PglB/VioB family sugar acetyltransferase [Telmatospirillum sp. J64-1]